MLSIDSSQVASFAVQLRAVPPEFRRELRPRLRRAGERVAARVRSRASWSSRIPAATKVRASFAAGATGGVQVYVDAVAAPHARPWDQGSGGNRGVLRHPVFGNTDVWVQHATRPFFVVEVRRSEPEVVAEIQSAIDDVFSRLGRQ